MKEEDRLAAMVVRIDNDVAIVPRGVYLRTPLNEVVPNKMFQGVWCVVGVCVCVIKSTTLFTPDFQNSMYDIMCQ